MTPVMPTPRFGLGTGVGNDVLYAIGGTMDDLGACAVVEAFRPGTGPPTGKDQCKDGGWQNFDIPRMFKNQGDCVQFVKIGK